MQNLNQKIKAALKDKEVDEITGSTKGEYIYVTKDELIELVNKRSIAFINKDCGIDRHIPGEDKMYRGFGDTIKLTKAQANSLAKDWYGEKDGIDLLAQVYISKWNHGKSGRNLYISF